MGSGSKISNSGSGLFLAPGSGYPDGNPDFLLLLFEGKIWLTVGKVGEADKIFFV